MSETFFSANDLIVNNGFVRNPNRYYLEDYYEKLPKEYTTFVLTSGGNTNFNIIQPGGTILKNAYVVCLTIPDIADGNVGISISTTSGLAVGSGDIVKGSDTNLINAHTTMTLNTISHIFPTDLLVIPKANAGSVSIGYTASNRVLFCKVKTSTAVQSLAVGKFALITEFCDINTGVSPLNQNYYFSVTGSYTTTSLTSFNNYSGEDSGIKMITAGTLNDNVILVNKEIELGNSLWKTNKDIEWDCLIKTGSNIDDICFWAGLKLTNVSTYTTDYDQAYFLCSTDNSVSGISTSSGLVKNLYFIYSINTINYITNLVIKLEVSTLYSLKIRIDGELKISVFVNNAQYGLTNTSGNKVNPATNPNDKSVALTTGINLKPYIGVQQLSGTSKDLTLCYQKISKAF